MAKFNQKVFSARLVALRERRGWTQNELALESGLTRPTIANLETGLTGPSLKTACELAGALDVSLDVLAGFAPLPDAAAPVA